MKIASYKVNRKHRTGKPTPNASMWTVSEWVEIHLFAEAGAKKWKSSSQNVLWSILPASKKLSKIGEDPSNALYFAKFVCDNNDEWHGYPVRARGADVPPDNVLENWRQCDFIDKTDKKRIQTGKFQ